MSPSATASVDSRQPIAPQPHGGLDRFFKISERGSSVAREIRGGFATFFAMAYIIVLNPIILASAPDVTGHKLEFSQVSP
jgi:AGZA family xanthine/uracil permease-like MFS transporter